MKSKFTTFSALLIILLAGIQACKKESTDPGTGGGGNTTKTLNKTTLTPKKWYSQGSVFVHDFKTGGTYGTMGGTWTWKNNTDTMEIVTQAGYLPTYWKFYWNNDTMMACEKVGTFTTLEYKLHTW